MQVQNPVDMNSGLTLGYLMEPKEIKDTKEIKDMMAAILMFGYPLVV